MTTLATLLVAFGIDASDFKSGLAEAERTANTSGKAIAGRLAEVGGGIIAGGLATVGAGLAGMGLFLKSAADEAQEAQGNISQLEAVLKSTGGVAGVTSQAAQDLAQSFSETTRFSDDAVLAGENILLTFTNIGKDVFPGATQTALDMSQALGQDMKSSAIQLGKALQDPITGVSALARVGVNFTQAQKDQIKALVESGNVMSAQKLILQELQTEFGGSAVAAGQTFAGQMDILNNRIANVKEGIGMALLPVLERLMNQVIMPLIPTIETLGSVLAAALSGESTAELIQGLPPGVQAIAQALTWLAKTVVDFVTVGLPQLISGFMQLVTFLQENKGILVGALAAMGVAVGIFVFTVAVPAAIAFISAWAPVMLVLAAVAAAGYLLYTAWVNDWGGIQEKTRAVLDWLMPKLEAAKVFIGQVLATLRAWWAEHGDDIIAKARYAWDWVMNKVQAALDFIKLLIKPFQDAMAGDWRAVGEDLRAIVDQWTLWKQEFWSGLWRLIKTAFIQGTLDLIAYLQTVDWGKLGSDILRGMAIGMLQGALWLIQVCQSIAKAVVDVFKGYFGIKSPSTLMASEIGAPMAEGLMAGFKDTLGDFGMPAISKVSSMQPTFVSVNYAPMISTASELEATEALRPMFQRLARE